nr:MAG TPA: hypothetical protein [Caudoviricetes sp.]
MIFKVDSLSIQLTRLLVDLFTRLPNYYLITYGA